MRIAHLLIAGSLALSLLVTTGLSSGPRAIAIGEPVSARSDALIVGASVHFGIGGEYGYDPQRSAAAIHDLGLTSYRDDLGWRPFQDPAEGRPGQRPRKLYGFMQEKAARPLLVIGHPNPLVPGGDPPISAAAQDSFATFARDAAIAMKPFDPMYEIWNEWNMNAVRGQPWLVGPGDPSDPRAAVHYAELAKKASGEIAKASPGSTILVGAVGIDNDWSWTKAMVGMGGLENASGLSVHLYNHCVADQSKRTATEMIDRLADLQKFLRTRSNGADYPVYVTEFGWPTIETQCIITPDAAAANIAQFILWASATPWLKGAWIYELKNSHQDPKDLESGFGIYDYNYAPKPAACMTKESVQLIQSAKSIRLYRPTADIFLLQLTQQAGSTVVAWATPGSHATLSLPVDKKQSKVRMLCGSAVAGQTVDVGAIPVIISDAGVGDIGLHTSR
jgi:hypothetical protein